MPYYRIVRKSDQTEVSRYAASQPTEFDGFAFADFDHVEFEPDAPPAPPAESFKITRLAFLNRFTDAEAIAIDLASQGATVPAASMRRYMQKVNAATYIDLGRADTRAGVQALEAAGLLAAGRATVILNTPPTAEEAWNG